MKNEKTVFFLSSTYSGILNPYLLLSSFRPIQVSQLYNRAHLTVTSCVCHVFSLPLGHIHVNFFTDIVLIQLETLANPK